MLRLICGSLFFLLITVHSQGQNMDSGAVEIMFKTIERTRDIKTLSYTIEKIERIDGDFVRQVSFSKLNRSPLKVYLKQEFPKQGMEALYRDGGKVLVNPNGFPWFNIRLSPLGNLIRENQHHTIYESGYDHVMNVLEHIMLKYDEKVFSMLYVEKDTIWDSNPVWKIKLQNPLYKIDYYTMQEDETVMQVARRNMLSEYWLVEQNKSISSCNDKSPGTKIKQPSDYAPAMELYIDQIRLIPLVMKIYDGQGLFEHYSYYDVKVDPEFKEEEFQKNYFEYGF